MQVRRFAALAAALVTIGLVAGCGTGDSARPATQADAVSVQEPWIKAVDSGMTAGFASLANDRDTQIRIVAAESPAAGRMELHEVVPDATGAMTMRPKDGGFVIAAHSMHRLEPGADHLMFFDPPAPLTPGEDVTVTLRFEDGSAKPVTMQVRDFPGAEEHYEPGVGPTTPREGE